MLLFVTLLHIILCFVLMLVILLQPGKGSDVGAAFGGGGGSSSIFGPRGAGSFLSQATTVIAILFMSTSITLAVYSSASARSGSDVENAMKRLAKERIEGDAYKVPDQVEEPPVFDLPEEALPPAQPAELGAEPVPAEGALPTGAPEGAATPAPAPSPVSQDPT